MAELSCELSPLVFAELYSMLAGSPAYDDPLAERLAGLGWDLAWVQEAAERYELAWQGSLQAAASPDELFGLSSDHALLATWVLAPLGSTGSSYEFDNELHTRVNRRVRSDVPGLPSDLPNHWRPVVVGWTLGMVIGTLDSELPVVPANLPTDPNVREAYTGLVEHVLHLAQQQQPWPEMLGTSTFWRGTGMAEGLWPEADSGYEAVNQMIRLCRNAVPDHLGRQLAQHFREFTDKRNALSHVLNKPGKPSFTEVKDQAQDWQSIRLTILGVTQLLGAQVAEELTDTASRAVQAETWDRLLWELVTWD